MRFITLALLALKVAADEHDNCGAWAAAGECEANPGYMLVSCKQSCALYTAPAPYEPVASHFNEVEALDINGARVSFGEAFAGRVVLVTNVASYCGRTDSHYRELAAIHNKYADRGLSVVAFPCNQFGGQEPGTPEEIKAFAEGQGFQGHLMAKVDVNGPNTCAAYRSLKQATGVPDIPWNFGRYFLVLKSGQVRTYGQHCDPSSVWNCEQVPPSQFESDINKALAGLEHEL